MVRRVIKVKRSETFQKSTERVETARKVAKKTGRPIIVASQNKKASKTAKPWKEKHIKSDPFISKNVKCKKCKQTKKGAFIEKKSGVCVECILKGANA